MKLKLELPSEIYVATEPVNLRLSFDRLAGIVREQLGREPREDVLVVFHNKRRTHLKLLWHDGSGYWIGFKRLERRTLRIPLPIPPGASKVEISARELRVLLQGIDMRAIRAARRTVRRAV